MWFALNVRLKLTRNIYIMPSNYELIPGLSGYDWIKLNLELGTPCVTSTAGYPASSTIVKYIQKLINKLFKSVICKRYPIP